MEVMSFNHLELQRRKQEARAVAWETPDSIFTRASASQFSSELLNIQASNLRAPEFRSRWCAGIGLAPGDRRRDYHRCGKPGPENPPIAPAPERGPQAPGPAWRLAR